MTILTLTSDFGLVDGYVGVMKGVILRIAPHVNLVDLSHDIPPQDVRHAGYLLAHTAPYFPEGTVHLAVVDPGVGGPRRPLLVTSAGGTFVGPDNGLLTFALEAAGSRAWVLDRPETWLTPVSKTFHGRDIFAPVAARLAAGARPEELGTPVTDPVRLPPLLAERAGNGAVTGHVVYSDRFGNLISNIPSQWLAQTGAATGGWTCEIAGQRIAGPAATYVGVPVGDLLFLTSSGDTVEVAVREGNAARRLAVQVGAVIRLAPA